MPGGAGDRAELADLAARVLPVLLFFVAITVVAEIADTAGVFDVAGHWTARVAGTARRWSGCSSWRSRWRAPCSSAWTRLRCCSPPSASQSRPSSRSRRYRLRSPRSGWPTRRACCCPVSNLTNLLALHHFEALGLGHGGYLRLAALPAAGAVLGTVAVLWTSPPARDPGALPARCTTRPA